jgi:hypothetical protein
VTGGGIYPLVSFPSITDQPRHQLGVEQKKAAQDHDE